jgi:hypothetical protein
MAYMSFARHLWKKLINLQQMPHQKIEKWVVFLKYSSSIILDGLLALHQVAPLAMVSQKSFVPHWRVPALWDPPVRGWDKTFLEIYIINKVWIHENW